MQILTLKNEKMKKLNSLKLSHLSKAEMEKKEMHNLSGGQCNGLLCTCGCAYINTGGSSTYMNYNANMSLGGHPSYNGI